VTRCYLADGRRVTWCPPPVADPAGSRWAVDAEIAAQPVPPALATRTGIRDPEEFWCRWTAVEVACKLLDIPVMVWLKRYGIGAPPAGLSIATFRYDDLIVSVGSISYTDTVPELNRRRAYRARPELSYGPTATSQRTRYVSVRTPMVAADG
jgi:hypothetical protein